MEVGVGFKRADTGGEGVPVRALDEHPGIEARNARIELPLQRRERDLVLVGRIDVRTVVLDRSSVTRIIGRRYLLG